MTFEYPKNVGSLTELFQWLNRVTNMAAGDGLLISLWVIWITWLVGKGKDIESVMLSTGLVLIVAIFGQPSSFITYNSVIILLVAFAITALATWVVK